MLSTSLPSPQQQRAMQQRTVLQQSVVPSYDDLTSWDKEDCVFSSLTPFSHLRSSFPLQLPHYLSVHRFPCLPRLIIPNDKVVRIRDWSKRDSGTWQFRLRLMHWLSSRELRMCRVWAKGTLWFWRLGNFFSHSILNNSDNRSLTATELASL